jgi:hypothetical protein
VTDLPPTVDDGDLIHRFNAASASELIELLRRPTPTEERVLRAHLGDVRYDRIHGMALRRGQTRGFTKFGNVLVAHGIMGGELTSYPAASSGSTKVWASYLQLILGRFMWLALKDDGIQEKDKRQSLRATGMIQKYYAELTLHLSETWNAQPFWFDWRKDIHRSAAELQERAAAVFGAGAPFHVVAHSMGGLVARMFIKQNRSAWEAMQKDGAKKGGRLIMLGTPNYGSFAVAQIVTGLEGILRKLDLFDTRNNLGEYVGVANTFPGSYQMMPAASKGKNWSRLYEAKTWAPTDVPQALLDRGAAFHDELEGVEDDWMSYVAGFDQETLSGVRDWDRLHEQDGYDVTLDGDGRVPHALGLLKAGRVFYVKESHGSLPTNETVQTAAEILLRQDGNITVDGLYSKLPANRGPRKLDAAATANQRIERLNEEMRELQTLGSRARGTRSIPTQDASPEDGRIAEEIVLSGWLGRVEPMSGQMENHQSSTLPETNPPSPNEPACTIEVAVYRGGIQNAHLLPGDANPVDVVSVGLYIGVRPDGAARALDKSVSLAMGASGDERLLTQMLERGVIQAGVGQPFILPDPREGGSPERIIALTGMGYAGRFGAPELTVTARELCWTTGRIEKKHLATVLIGAGVGNMKIPAAVEAWLRGIARAQGGMAIEARLRRVTFVETSRARAAEIDEALTDLSGRLKSIIDVSYAGLTDSGEPEWIRREGPRRDPEVPARVSFTFDGASGAYRFGSITQTAALPERAVQLDPALVLEANQLLASMETSPDQFSWGRFLERLLIPAEFRTELQSSEPLVMMLDSTTASIHWEMMAQPSYDGQVKDSGKGDFEKDAFLGTARGLTRQLRTTFAPPPEPPPPVRQRLRILVVADPDADAPLPGAQLEGSKLAELFDDYRVRVGEGRVQVVTLLGPVQATRTQVLHQLTTTQFDVLHFAGHCFFDREQPDNCGWVFGSNKILSAKELNRIDRVPPFVFSNACESGMTPDRAARDLPQSFAEAFFGRGVTNFICTAWPISDEAATDFAWALYSRLLGMDDQGGSAGSLWEAMQAARITLAKSGSGRTTWGAYQHYGNPYFRLVPTDAQRQELATTDTTVPPGKSPARGKVSPPRRRKAKTPPAPRRRR